MALNLDARQRAMLHAMGITVWLPEPEAAPAVLSQALTVDAPAPEAEAAAPAPVARRIPPPAPVQEVPAPAEPAVPVPVAAPAPAPTPAPAPLPLPAESARAPRRYVQQPVAGAPGLGWRLGPARPVYPATPPAGAGGEGGWLILLEPPANSLPLPPAQRPGPECARTALEGDAARLLDNMLRALDLQDHPRLYSAALHRVLPPAEGQPAPEVPALQPSLEALLRELRPACVLVLGLATARAVLQRQDALGRLRAEPHRIAGVPAVVSYDPNYLLRAPQAKAGAWADLCHAQAFVTGRRIPPGPASE
ncbi:uracil-DNA glycosylase, family 4 [Delftia tsuruhatensis]|uniref:uracil-DNA glycosylase family protein n=1 Tax=Delftia tsuruhatensis TaxID=180282 RepID=UPI001E6B2D89|nr:uracil-DNA glycosylase family protein [Delftia tsuruhatensis]CAB5678559.1 uracil-DNA glycosylase, family 4 [Delftia tsuruhatensis]CAC9693139.1 uracil-DNA glycosylase, family 4 [Delftia tsuruhatensis]